VQASAACDSRFHAPDANRSCIHALENFRFKKLRSTIIARSAFIAGNATLQQRADLNATWKRLLEPL
jgi:hypothetical protein